jgi:hypothetical protein
MQFAAYLHWELLWVSCKEHGVKALSVPWMGNHGLFTFRIPLSKFLTHNNCLPKMFADIYMLAQGFGVFGMGIAET